MQHKAYVKDADGDSAVLFIHGFLGSPGHFSGLIPLVPEDYGIYNILLEGHGKGTREFAAASMKAWKRQVEKAVCELEKKYKKIYIAAHSLGTLLAMEAAINHPQSIKALWFLGSPLKIWVKPQAFKNTIKSFFNVLSANDSTALAYKNSHSVTLDKRIWLYAGWIPRYLELFEEAKKARDNILRIEIPVFIYQSAGDELVSLKSMDYIPQKDNIHVKVLENSAHFIYDEKDFSYLAREFSHILKI